MKLLTEGLESITKLTYIREKMEHKKVTVESLQKEIVEQQCRL